jgi:hypothetical protein
MKLLIRNILKTRIKKLLGAHNNDVDDESPTVERQEYLSNNYLRNLSILF